MNSDENKSESPVARGLEASIGEILNDRPAYLNEGERDSKFKRWTGFASIVFVLAFLFGLGFALEDYYLGTFSDRYVTRSAARSRIKDETIDSLKFKFYIGSGVGALLGIAYSVKCVMKDIDP